MVSIDQIEKGIANYLDAELIQQLPANGFQRVIAGVGLSLLIKRSSVLAEKVKSNSFIQLLGIFDENGNVDIDTLRDEIKKQMPADGIKIDVPGVGIVNFTKSDVDSVYSYILK